VRGTFTTNRIVKRREEHLDRSYTLWTGEVYDADGERVTDLHTFEAVVQGTRIMDLVEATVAVESRRMDLRLDAVERGYLADPFGESQEDDHEEA
jgi:hypothetical protein